MTRFKIVLVAIGLLLISGCGTFVTQNLDLNKTHGDHQYREQTYEFANLHDECDDPNEFISFPYVYSGIKYDIMYLTRPFNCGLDTGEVGMINNFLYLLIYPFAIVDIPLSLMVDTALLPQTIKQQNTYGNMLDAPYFKIAKAECRKNDDKCLEYYNKGFALLPKYFGDAPLSEINIYLDIMKLFMIFPVFMKDAGIICWQPRHLNNLSCLTQRNMVERKLNHGDTISSLVCMPDLDSQSKWPPRYEPWRRLRPSARNRKVMPGGKITLFMPTESAFGRHRT